MKLTENVATCWSSTSQNWGKPISGNKYFQVPSSWNPWNLVSERCNFVRETRKGNKWVENERCREMRDSRRWGLYSHLTEPILSLRPLMKSPARSSAVFFFLVLFFLGAFVCTRLLNSTVSHYHSDTCVFFCFFYTGHFCFPIISLYFPLIMVNDICQNSIFDAVDRSRYDC